MIANFLRILKQNDCFYFCIYIKDRGWLYYRLAGNWEEAIIDACRGNLAAYDESELRVARTRSRVIMRVMKHFRPYTQRVETQRGLTEGYSEQFDCCVYIISATRSEALGYHGGTTRSGRPAAELMLYREFETELERIRAYGQRPTRHGGMRTANRTAERINKPAKYRTLQKGPYHAVNMGSLDPGNVEGIKMGVELEFSQARGVEADPDYFGLMDDGSIPQQGGELVSRPDNRKGLTDAIGEFLGVNCARLAVNASCGMHVHVDKRQAGNAAPFIKQRMYARKNQARYIKIAGREPNTYWSFSNDGRYQALNDRNERTIEFRLFSGTTSPHKVRRRLQWVEAMVNWGNKQNRAINGDSVLERFSEVNNRHSGTYEYRQGFGPWQDCGLPVPAGYQSESYVVIWNNAPNDVYITDHRTSHVRRLNIPAEQAANLRAAIQ